MPLNKVKGNMYDFVTHTWNTVKGKCPHNCEYCYMKRFGNQPELHFDEKELNTDLGKNNFIFVGSSCDMWATEVKTEWIIKTIDHCVKFTDNRYLLQSKNPFEILLLFNYQPFINAKICTTIESDVFFAAMGRTPELYKRAEAMHEISLFPMETMVTIEPIMDFNMSKFLRLIKYCNPEQVNIGADSNVNKKGIINNSNYAYGKLPEPPPEKIRELIQELEKFTTVKLKPNLKRLLPY